MRKRSVIFSLLLMLLVCMATAPAALAAEPPTYTMRIVYADEGTPIQDAAFSIYRVADTLEHGEYEVVSEFAPCGAVLKNQMSNEEWVAATDLFNDWAARGHAKPLTTGTTGQDGTLTLLDLEEGVYLVKGDSRTAGGRIYTPQPFCVVVPELDENWEPLPELTVEPKYESVPVPPPAPTPTPAPTPEPTPAPTPTPPFSIPEFLRQSKTGMTLLITLIPSIIVTGMIIALVGVIVASDGKKAEKKSKEAKRP